MTSLLLHSQKGTGVKTLGLIGVDFVQNLENLFKICLPAFFKICQLTVSTATLGAIFSPISLSLSAKNCLSSVALIDSIGVPRT